jgi:hypothetical protein
MQKTSQLRRLAGRLLATTCLTAASALAGTITYTEGAGGLPADFPGTFGSATAAVAAANPGTTIVNGAVNNAGSDPRDFFELTGLGAGNFTLSAMVTEGGNGTVYVFNTSGTLLEGGGGPQTNGAGLFGFTSPGVNPLNFGSLAIPGNGDLVIEVEMWHEDASNYTITVNTTPSSVPEPSTAGMVGLGVAGALTLARKRRKQQ